MSAQITHAAVHRVEQLVRDYPNRGYAEGLYETLDSLTLTADVIATLVAVVDHLFRVIAEEVGTEAAVLWRGEVLALHSAVPEVEEEVSRHA